MKITRTELGSGAPAGRSLPRVYWQPNYTSGQRDRITFELSSDEAWSFPRAHLVGFECPDPSRAVLRFASHLVEVTGPDVLQAVQRIHSGDAWVVSQAGLNPEEPPGTALVTAIQRIETEKHYESDSTQPGA